MPTTDWPTNTQPNASGDTLDIVGIGALNLDYVASAPALTTGDPEPISSSLVTTLTEVVTELEPSLEWNTERAVSESAIKEALQVLPASLLPGSLGGSAFNTIHALATMRLGLRLGYLGITGRVPPGAPSFSDEFARLEIDNSRVRHIESRYAGICLSVMENGEPTMLTHAGANSEFSEYLAAEFDATVEYLTRARLIHVTSFFDSMTPHRLLRVLSAVKKIDPSIVISLDPGHEWCSRMTPAFVGMLALSDFVSVNEPELQALASAAPSTDDEHAARWVLRRFMNPQSVLITKSPSGVQCFRTLHGDITMDQYTHMPLPEAEIIDATGAGDVFVAGLLAGIVNDSHRLAPGALLGMRLAKLHLQYVGAHGQDRFAEIAREFIRRGS